MSDKTLKRIRVGRAINGISLNGYEWLLDPSGDILWFGSVNEAQIFLLEHGVFYQDLELFNYDEQPCPEDADVG